MSGCGFSVGSSGYDDEDRRGLGFQPDVQNRNHKLLTAWPLLPLGEGIVRHDSKENMTSIPASLNVTWYIENKLIAADNATDNNSMDDIFYKFNALGSQVSRNDGTANVVYFQDGQQAIVYCPFGTAVGSQTCTCVNASYIDEPVMRGGSGGLRCYHRNQQYSITALTDGGGSIVERYAYTAYGQVTFFDGSGSQISNSEISNRYTYTGREWDEGLNLYHYRARMYDTVGGRFVSQDPIGFEGSMGNLYELLTSKPLINTDPTGMYGPMPGWIQTAPKPTPPPGPPIIRVATPLFPAVHECAQVGAVRTIAGMCDCFAWKLKCIPLPGKQSCNKTQTCTSVPVRPGIILGPGPSKQRRRAWGDTATVPTSQCVFTL